MVKTKWKNVVAIKRRNGNIDYYFRVRRKGEKASLIRMPSDAYSPEFAAMYRDLISPNDNHGHDPRSFAALIVSYKGTPEFRQLADRTKRDYLRNLDMIGEWLGDKNAERFPRREAIRMRDQNQHRKATANHLLQMLSVLMEHAINLDWRRDNPARGVKKLALGEGYRPWKEDEMEAFRAQADPIARLIFELALGTGQRPGDLVEMRWMDWDRKSDEIRILQRKTGVELWIPPTDALRPFLESAFRSTKGLTILAAERTGRPYTYSGIAQRIAKVCKRIGIEGASLHGLRKNATIELAEAGCTVAQIKAITGHTTDAMVAHYSKKAEQRRLARTANQIRSGNASGNAPE